MTANTSPDQGQSRSPSEHSEAERAPMLNEIAALLLKRYDDCREKTGLDSAVEFELLRLALDESNAARATPAEAGERTLPSIDTPELLGMLDSYATDGTLGYAHWHAKIVAHINAYGQQCARYAVEKYKRTRRVQLDPEFKALIDKMSESRQTSAVLPNGSAVFVNYGEQPEDTAHLNCTACGGSGHIDDQIAQSPQVEPVAWRYRLKEDRLGTEILPGTDWKYTDKTSKVKQLGWAWEIESLIVQPDIEIAHHTDKGD